MSPIKLASDPKSKWVARWMVPSSSNPNKSYVVARTRDNEYGCSCPVWIYRRQVCKHIKAVQGKEPEPVVSEVVGEKDQPISILEFSRASLVDV